MNEPLNLSKKFIKIEPPENVIIQNPASEALEHISDDTNQCLNLCIKDEQGSITPLDLSKRQHFEVPLLIKNEEITITIDKIPSIEKDLEDCLEAGVTFDENNNSKHEYPKIENNISGNDLKKIKCNICSYENSELRLYDRHLKTHRKNYFLTCEFCTSKTFREKRDLDLHILRTHSKNREALKTVTTRILKCKFCDFKTVRTNNMERHIITHRKEKNIEINFASFECYHCKYATCYKGSMIKHVRLHGSLRNLPHRCEFCEKTFNEKKSLDSHILKNHPDSELIEKMTNRVWYCEYCDYKDINRSKITRHTSARHAKKEKN